MTNNDKTKFVLCASPELKMNLSAGVQALMNESISSSGKKSKAVNQINLSDKANIFIHPSGRVS